MADRWVSKPHVFPNCCHRCLKAGEEDGPYFHEEWDYAKPDRWPGVSPEHPQIARMFTCRKCFLHAASLEGAPLTPDSAKQLKQAEATIDELAARVLELEDLSRRPVEVLDADTVREILAEAVKRPAPRAKKAA